MGLRQALCEPSAIQSMLREDIAALVTRLKTECRVWEWFFFRYEDPDWHLRLRVRAPGSAERARVLDLIESTTRSLQSKEAVWRLQYDTYFREVERFGGPKVCGLVERLLPPKASWRWPRSRRGRMTTRTTLRP